MDPNKLDILRELDYTIPRTCGLCANGNFDRHPQAIWGKCNIITYSHQKHTGPPRHLSIYYGGGCSLFERGEVTVGSYEEFVENG